MKILNAYAGIGGNRKLWEGHEVTAVEIDPDIAAVYGDYFPEDELIVGDAHDFIRENYERFDFIWTSPPCQSHTRMNTILVGRGQKKAPYPDMKLYQEIIFLRNWYKGKWVAENVIPMYEPLIPGKRVERHLFWSNFRIGRYELGRKRPSIEFDNSKVFEKEFGFDLSGYKFRNTRRDQVARNCVHPETGRHILQMAQGIWERESTEQQEINFEV